jgi:predicted nucleic acid-binding protein
VKVVADANVLLSAVLGGRAKLVLNHPRVEAVVTTEGVVREVQEYTILLARKRRLNVDTWLLAAATIPVSIIPEAAYSGATARAKALIARRNADDVNLLALALHLRLPIWSNDNDFEGTGVEWYTTAELLRMLGISDRH